MMEKSAFLIFLLFFGGRSLADQFDVLGELDDDLIRGPEPLTGREKRQSQNYNRNSCPPSWNRPGPSMPSMPCPPGTSRQGQPPYGGQPYRPSPCPPWVDEAGRCHVSDVVIKAATCKALYTEIRYAQWQRNARMPRPVGMPGTPAPPCQPTLGRW